MKEPAESRSWLRIIAACGYLDEKRLAPLIDESLELTRMMGASVATQTAVEWVDLTERYLDPATGFCRPELFRDGTHPSRAGYEIWFEALTRVMNPPPTRFLRPRLRFPREPSPITSAPGGTT